MSKYHIRVLDGGDWELLQDRTNTFDTIQEAETYIRRLLAEDTDSRVLYCYGLFPVTGDRPELLDMGTLFLPGAPLALYIQDMIEYTMMTYKPDAIGEE